MNIKNEFPILNKKINGKDLIYFDNAATTQKTKSVIAALKNYYENYNANIHRGFYSIAEKATERYEQTREKIRKFINANSAKEIIFTRNTTESINLVAYSWGEKNIKTGDEIIVSEMEHHSNFVPWQQLAKRKKAKLIIATLDKNLEIDEKKLAKLFTKKTKIFCISASSNVTGTMPDIKKFAKLAHKFGALIFVDGAQSIAHLKTDVKALDADFFAFSSHKMYGPTGVGVLYAKEKILEEMPPFLYGGEMISEVTIGETKFNELPWKFEAGTPNIADVIALEKAIEFIETIGFKKIQEHETKLLKLGIKTLSKHKEIKIYHTKSRHSGAIIAFTIKGVHPHDISEIFDRENICIRAGKHCTEPLHTKLEIPASARISFAIYNTEDEIKKIDTAIKKILKIFK